MEIFHVQTVDFILLRITTDFILFHIATEKHLSLSNLLFHEWGKTDCAGIQRVKGCKTLVRLECSAVHFPRRGPSYCKQPSTYHKSLLMSFPQDFETTIDLVHTPNITSVCTIPSSGIVFFQFISYHLSKVTIQCTGTKLSSPSRYSPSWKIYTEHGISL